MRGRRASGLGTGRKRVQQHAHLYSDRTRMKSELRRPVCCGVCALGVAPRRKPRADQVEPQDRQFACTSMLVRKGPDPASRRDHAARQGSRHRNPGRTPNGSTEGYLMFTRMPSAAHARRCSPSGRAPLHGARGDDEPSDRHGQVRPTSSKGLSSRPTRLRIIWNDGPVESGISRWSRRGRLETCIDGESAQRALFLNAPPHSQADHTARSRTPGRD